jgi:hypothetical protein
MIGAAVREGAFIPQTALDVDRVHGLRIELETLGIAGFRLRCLYDCVLQRLPMTDSNAVPMKTTGTNEEAVAVAEKLAHLEHEEWVRSRKQPSKELAARALKLLDKAGNKPVEAGDELPKDYRATRR